MRPLFTHLSMSILRQSDLSSEDMQLALGRKMPGARNLNAHNRHGVTVDEDGETSSVVTMWEQTRDRLNEAISSSDLVTGSV